MEYSKDILFQTIDLCLDHINKASEDKYDEDKATQSAALFLKAQYLLSKAIEEEEILVRGVKNQIASVEGSKYFDFRENNKDKKITEATMSNYLAKDQDVLDLKSKLAELEASVKKYTLILSMMKDGHIYFRNISRTKTWAE